MEVAFCSIYTQERDSVSAQQLQDLLNQLGTHYIIGGDFNGHSPLWGHEDFNRIGKVVEDIYFENHLILLNDTDEPTYFNKRFRKRFRRTRSKKITIESQTPVEALNELTTKISILAEEVIPRTSQKRHRGVVPWWNKETDGTIKERNKALKRFKRNPDTYNLILLNKAQHKAKKLIEANKRDNKERLYESIDH